MAENNDIELNHEHCRYFSGEIIISKYIKIILTCEKIAMPLFVRSVACRSDGVRHVSSEASTLMSNSWPGWPVYLDGLEYQTEV